MLDFGGLLLNLQGCVPVDDGVERREAGQVLVQSSEAKEDGRWRLIRVGVKKRSVGIQVISKGLVEPAPRLLKK